MKHLQREGNLSQAESPVTAGCMIQRQTTALLQTLLSGSVAVWGTGPNANNKGFCHCYHFTLFQIVLETIRDKGCTASSGISPLQDSDMNTFQASECLSFTLFKIYFLIANPKGAHSAGRICQLTVCRLWGLWDKGAEPWALYTGPPLTLQRATATTDDGAALGQSNQIKISL